MEVAACIGHEVEVVWEMENHVGLDDAVELVAMLDMVAVEYVMGMETSVVVWAVVAAVDVLVVNTARDTSWLLGKSNKVDVNVNRGESNQPLNLNK